MSNEKCVAVGRVEAGEVVVEKASPDIIGATTRRMAELQDKSMEHIGKMLVLIEGLK